MKCLIILNGRCDDSSFIKELALKNDYIICADGGYSYAMRCGIKPDLVVGDFDSCDAPQGDNILKYPIEKDVTDCELAIEQAIAKGYKRITLACALGGRLDHTLANLLLCFSYQSKADIIVEDENCVIMSLFQKRLLGDYMGKTFSIIPVSTCEITISGVYYPISCRKVSLGDTLTVSNIVTEKEAYAELNSGKALLIINKNI